MCGVLFLFWSDDLTEVCWSNTRWCVHRMGWMVRWTGCLRKAQRRAVPSRLRPQRDEPKAVSRPRCRLKARTLRLLNSRVSYIANMSLRVTTRKRPTGEHRPLFMNLNFLLNNVSNNLNWSLITDPGITCTVSSIITRWASTKIIRQRVRASRITMRSPSVWKRPSVRSPSTTRRRSMFLNSGESYRCTSIMTRVFSSAVFCH